MSADDAPKPAPEARFLTGDLMGHVTRMSIAGSVGLMAVFLVDLVDLFFISLLGQQELAAAVGYAGAIMFFTVSISIGLAIAKGALCARAIGAGDRARARRAATNVLAVALGVTTLAAALVWIAAPTLVGLLGAKGETAELAARFLRFVTPSLPLLFVMMGAGAVLRANGDAAASMNVTIIAALANGVLDPILIFGLGLDLDGAALASVASRVIGAAYGLWLLIRRYDAYAAFDAAALKADLSGIVALAGPAMLTNVATPVSAAFVTRVIAEFGDDAVAGFAIVSRITPVAFGLVFALSGAVGPIIGQNFGALRYDRVAETITQSLKFLAYYVVGVSVILFLARGVIADVFDATEDARVLIYWFCGPLSLLFYFNGALFTANAAFNNLGRPFISTWLNWGRHTIGAAPPALLLADAIGAPGALLGLYLGGVAFAVVAVWRAYALVAQRAAPAGDPAANLAYHVPLWFGVNWRS